MIRTHPHRSALEWGIKHSLVQYVLGMDDGTAEVSPPAHAIDDRFRFPAAEHDPALDSDALRFTGTVTLSGHGGMLKLVFADPWLVPGASLDDAWTLTIADAYDPGRRVAFATVSRVALDPAGGATTSGTRLTADGADLFFAGPYSAGTDLDDPVVIAHD